jgi:sulfur transfer protein SufE
MAKANGFWAVAKATNEADKLASNLNACTAEELRARRLAFGRELNKSTSAKDEAFYGRLVEACNQALWLKANRHVAKAFIFTARTAANDA